MAGGPALRRKIAKLSCFNTDEFLRKHRLSISTEPTKHNKRNSVGLVYLIFYYIKLTQV